MTQLTATRQVYVRIGAGHVKMDFANGPTVHAELVQSVAPLMTFVGSGQWTQE